MNFGRVFFVPGILILGGVLAILGGADTGVLIKLLMPGLIAAGIG